MTTGRINQVTAALLRRGDPADVTGNCCRRVPLPAPGGTLAREQALTFARGNTVIPRRTPLPSSLTPPPATERSSLASHWLGTHAGIPKHCTRYGPFPGTGKDDCKRPSTHMRSRDDRDRNGSSPTQRTTLCRVPSRRDRHVHPGRPPSAGGETASAGGESRSPLCSLSPLLPTLTANAAHRRRRRNATRAAVSPTPGG